MGYRFSEASEKRFQKMLEVFPEKRSLILPCLYILQRENGFVDQAGMDYIATRLGDPISLAQVYGVATFYTLYNKNPSVNIISRSAELPVVIYKETTGSKNIFAIVWGFTWDKLRPIKNSLWKKWNVWALADTRRWCRSTTIFTNN